MKDKCIFDKNRTCQAGRHTTCNECIYGPNGTEFKVTEDEVVETAG